MEMFVMGKRTPSCCQATGSAEPVPMAANTSAEAGLEEWPTQGCSLQGPHQPMEPGGGTAFPQVLPVYGTTPSLTRFAPCICTPKKQLPSHHPLCCIFSHSGRAEVRRGERGSPDRCWCRRGEEAQSLFQLTGSGEMSWTWLLAWVRHFFPQALLQRAALSLSAKDTTDFLRR